jgi:hypothetical protein
MRTRLAWTVCQVRALCTIDTAKRAVVGTCAMGVWPPFPSADLPTLEQLQAVRTRGRHIPIGSLFSCCRAREPSADGAACPEPAADVAAPAGAGLTDEGGCERPWTGRLRSSSHTDVTHTAAGTNAGAQFASAASSSDRAARRPQPCRALHQSGNLVLLTSLQRLPSCRRPVPLPAPSPATVDAQ